MRGWQFTGVGEPLRLKDDIADPAPGPGELVIDTAAAGLCHSDLSYLDGTLSSLLGPAPIVLGHEFAGTVAETGDGVTGFKVGDRVAVNADTDGPGTAIDGGFATKVLVRDWEAVHIPEGVSWEQAAPATDAGRTAHHAVFGIGEVTEGTRLGIVGYGGLGSLGALMAKAKGAEVFVADVSEQARASATQDGARKVVTDVRELAGDELDVIIDFAGFDTTTSGAIAAVRKRGRVVQVGLAKPTVTFDVQDLVLREVQLHGSVTGTTEDLASVLRFIKDGAISSRVETLTFDQIGDGYDRMKRGDYHGRLVALFE
ncbi:zinc-binding dehydrogenase [Amycolatopsis sp.]|uniref:alcohol dehydrogenase catalytic domain-containing protein n=1 Tax=Amycolatopsis sp. TaxID=37632 RepID=UPI002CF5D7D2|nr:zinc-binding dehydrogenase [Amycolatopsis sp.]HVV09299.1 zinc-binding dehydrogenase [Amycolatopsis sp.]